MTQQEVVLRMLRERGEQGVSAHELVYRRGITRAAAIVHDLREAGHDILTVDEGNTDDGRRKLARYVLRATPTRTSPPRYLQQDLPIPVGKPLSFECGCIRAASGDRWDQRCDDHAVPVS